MLASVAEQASLSLTSSETPEYTFCHDQVYIEYLKIVFLDIFWSNELTKPPNRCSASRVKNDVSAPYAEVWTLVRMTTKRFAFDKIYVSVSLSEAAISWFPVYSFLHFRNVFPT